MVTKSLKRIFLTILVACTFSAAVAADVPSKPCLRIGMFDVLAANEAVLDTAKRIFEIADVCVDLVIVPPRRAELMDLEGSLDGELQRTMLWARMHADKIIPVPTPLFTEKMMALSLEGKQLHLTSLQDLRGKRVLIAGGHRWLEARMAEMDIEPLSASRIPRYMELLRSGPVDVGLMDASILKFMGNMTDIKIQEVAKVDYHIMLQRKYAGIVDRLDAAARAVKSGTAMVSAGN